MSPRISLWLLASAGVLLGHVLGYLVAYPTDAERAVAVAGHAYLGPLGMVAIPAGLLAVLGIAVRTVRRLGAAPSLRQLAVIQVALFAAQEILERIPGPGAPLDVVSERAVWFGLAAQVLVAWIAVRLVGLVVRAVRAVAGSNRPRTSTAPRPAVTSPQDRAPGRSIVACLPGRRGPPPFTGAFAFI